MSSGGVPSAAATSSSQCCGQHGSRGHSARRAPPLAIHEQEVGVADTLQLEPLTEEAFVANLQQRFKRDLIYTSAGDVLVSVNPYKKLALYSLDVVEAYRTKALLSHLPPHIFALADKAHWNLRERNEEQCVVVSGESGSGKTEAARIVLQYVTVAGSGPTGAQQDPSLAPIKQVRDRLLQAGPLLEAFGNAKTHKNDNSSRFGKYLDVEFDFKGDPVGGTFTSYLLEKSRVTRQLAGERNFHIFYQLLTGADIQLLKSLKLHRNIDNYAFLRPSRPLSMETIDDKRDFQVTKKALETLGFSAEDVVQIFKVVASVLKLGNIGFTPTSNIDGTEGCTVTNDYELFEVCGLLGTNPMELTSALTQRTILAGPVLDSPSTNPAPPPPPPCGSLRGVKSGGCSSSVAGTPPSFVPSSSMSSTGSRDVYEVCEMLQHSTLARLTLADERGSSSTAGELVVADLSASEATASRDILCRALYSRLFAWLVKQVNDATRVRKYGKRKVLGIMDIYGFEVFDQNNFEQFIINFCNEKLQQAVAECTLRLRQDEMLREGIEWTPVDFFNNTPVCELIEKNNHGILAVLDEESQRGGPGGDESFLARLCHTCGSSAYFETRNCAPHSAPTDLPCNTSVPPNCFRLRHYAGTVTYNVAGFVEKNNDTLPLDLSLAMFRCEHPLLKNLFPEGNPKRTTLKRAASAGTQFKISVGALMGNLQSKTPHFIRCIKPNELKQPRIFENALVQHQVRYLCLVQTIKVRKTSFAHSESYESFLHRYKMLSPHTWPCWRGSAVEGASYLLRDLPLSSPHFAFGRTKIFIRSERTVSELEEFRRQRLEDLAASVQKMWRGYRCRQRYLLMRQSQIVIASAWRSWRAREEYRELKRRKQIEWAVQVIQTHYLQWRRRQYLQRLCVSLPSDSPVCREWPMAAKRLADANLMLRRMHHKWRCHKYRLKFDQTARNRMREKVTASIIFKDRKASYPRSVSHPFLGDYVRLRQNVQWKKICVETNDQYVVFADIINKITRSSGKFVPILFVLSTSSMLILDQRTLQIKYRVPATEIYRLSLSPYLDDVAIFHIKASCELPNLAHEAGCSDCSRAGGSSPLQGAEHATGCLFQSDLGKKKGDFVFHTGHVIEIVTKLFLVVQNAVGKPPEVNINTEFEANFGSQSVMFSFKCAGLPEVQPGQIKIMRKGSRMEVLV
ncbi:unconventional myosin-Ia-like isoform X3 [Neocloeon triangulifer]|uniref:unconventional myosin-Ia-like isoform X3 n=1 Tax=Neocloeon triangulifer TaxID=2078957 RepID=UPI00286F6353|nr:unconventional myosin-Ia-like isoform X3 [Neocloeon triangulifer]